MLKKYIFYKYVFHNSTKIIIFIYKFINLNIINNLIKYIHYIYNIINKINIKYNCNIINQNIINIFVYYDIIQFFVWLTMLT